MKGARWHPACYKESCGENPDWLISSLFSLSLMSVIPSPTAPLKYVVGIDIAKDTFVACFGRIDVQQQLRFGKEAIFDNTLAGFTDLLAWTSKQQTTIAPLWFVVEATGVYYEALAYFLADNQQALSVLLPNKVKHFAQSTEQKSKRARPTSSMPACSAAWAWSGHCPPGSHPRPPCASCGPWPANAKA